jgi:hypothetical protein
MTYPSDKQIAAARTARAKVLSEREAVAYARMSADYIKQANDDAMRAALIAAREAEPPPSVEDFDELLDAYDGWLTADFAPEWQRTSRRRSLQQDLRDLFEKAAGR